MTPAEVLDLRLADNNAEAATVREYLIALLRGLWGDPYGNFSSKRPFGDSGWRYEIYEALIRDGAVPGWLDEDGFVAEFDEDAADDLILAAIDELGRRSG